MFKLFDTIIVLICFQAQLTACMNHVHLNCNKLKTPLLHLLFISAGFYPDTPEKSI